MSHSHPPGLQQAAWHLDELQRSRAEVDRLYLEFLRVPSMSCGLFELPAGGTDPQTPHPEDEVYYVISGRSKFVAADSEQSVEAGSILFVQRGVEHRFFDIEEDLTVLVLFAPAESSP